MYPAGVEIRRRDTYTLVDLVLNPGSRLDGGGHVQARLRTVEGRQCGRFFRGAIRRRSVGIGLDRLHLPRLVEIVAVCVEQQVVGEAMIKNPIAGAQHGLGLLSASTTDAIGKRHPWSEINFVGYVILSLNP